MHAVLHKSSNRGIQDLYQQFGSTVMSHCSQEVLKACLHLHIKYVKLLTIIHRLAARISQDCKYAPYFDDCLRALDGAHTSMHILEHEYARTEIKKMDCYRRMYLYVHCTSRLWFFGSFYLAGKDQPMIAELCY